MDGATNQKGSRIGVILVSPKRVTMEKSLRLGFLATNNETEHKTLQVGLDLVKWLAGKAVEVFLDSRLVVGQVKWEFKAKDQRMQGHLGQVKWLQSSFEMFPKNKSL